MQCRFFVMLSVFMVAVSPAFACGDNTPAQLQERAQAKFKTWDMDRNKLFTAEEFLAADGNFIGQNATDSEWVEFYKDKITAYDEFKKGDVDQSGVLTFDEWLTVRPPQQFLMNRGGC